MSAGQTIRIRNQALKCKHCGNGDFVHRTAQLNTAFLEFFDLGWLNKAADVYACTHCGFLHWFLEPEIREAMPAQQPHTAVAPTEAVPDEPPTDDDLTESTECLECHQTIPVGAAKCPACGWTYK
jgi:hypothetical protein